jgi:YD repeat-containing protein
VRVLAAGKVSKVSEAYAPGAAVVWAHQYTFDGLGRITQDLLPDGSATLYKYSGNTTTVTPPSNNPSNPVSPWKRYTTDAQGNLTSVSEPDPTLGTVTTSYSYDVLNHLTQVTMTRNGTTQTRTFRYNSGSPTPSTRRRRTLTIR